MAYCALNMLCRVFGNVDTKHRLVVIQLLGSVVSIMVINTQLYVSIIPNRLLLAQRLFLCGRLSTD